MFETTSRYTIYSVFMCVHVFFKHILKQPASWHFDMLPAMANHSAVLPAGLPRRRLLLGIGLWLKGWITMEEQRFFGAIPVWLLTQHEEHTQVVL